MIFIKNQKFWVPIDGIKLKYFKTWMIGILAEKIEIFTIIFLIIEKYLSEKFSVMNKNGSCL